MRLSRFVLSLVLAFTSFGCASRDPAPKDLDGLARFFFDGFDPGEEDVAVSDAELQDAVQKLHDAIGADDLADAQSGTLSDITQDELDAVGLTDKDPKEPQGMFIADVVHCDLDAFEKIILNPDQLSLYPEAYATYDRAFDKDPPDFLPTWTVTYKSSENALITNQFTATEKSGVRKVPDIDGAPFGRFIVGRVFMPAPAVFDNPGSEYTQDYQLEVFFSRAPGELVHFYGMWRYMHFGVLGDSNDGLFIDQTIGGMIDWDKKTDDLCAQ